MSAATHQPENLTGLTTRPGGTISMPALAIVTPPRPTEHERAVMLAPFLSAARADARAFTANGREARSLARRLRLSVVGTRPMRQARTTRTGRVTTARRAAAHRSRPPQASGPDGSDSPEPPPAPIGANRQATTSLHHLMPATARAFRRS